MITTPAFVRDWRWLRLVVETALVLAVVFGSYQLAYRYLRAADAPTFIDWELKPAVMFGCGYGLTVPALSSPAVENFIHRKSDATTCQEFAWGGAPTPAINIALANRYSLYGAGWAMRLLGVSWTALDSYLAFLFALSMACGYGLYRLAAGRVLAICGVAALACSPILIEIVTLRDFIKLPCFTVLWLTLGWVIQRGLGAGAKATVLPMIAGGALLGIGIGLRMDALVLVPVFVAVVILAVPGFGWRDLGLKSAATAAFIVMFFVTGGPILRSMSTGSNSAHVVVLGLMKPFDRGLSVEPAPYDIGAHYSDGYAYTVIVSHGLLKQGERLPILLGSAQYDQVGGRLLGTLARQFPADVLARGMGATFQIFRFPFDWRVRELSQKLPTFQQSPLVTRIGEWRSWALGLFEERELAGVVFVLVLASAFNWRLGALGFLLVFYLCGYSMLQFSRRHIFHLDLIPILLPVLAVQLPLSLVWRIGMRFRDGRDAGRQALKTYGRNLAIGTALLAAVVGMFVGTVWTARWWQQRSVTALVDTTLAAQWLPAPVTEEPLADLILQNGNPVATWYEVYITNPEQWKTATLLRVDGVVARGTEESQEPAMRQQYFKVTINASCGAKNVLVGVKYSGAGATVDYEFTRAFTVRTSTAGPSRLLMPAYYHLGSSWNRLDGFAVPADQRGCITGIERAADPASLPLPVAAFVLPQDWRERPLFQQLMARPEITIAGTPVDPLPDDVKTHRSGWRRNNNEPLALPVPRLEDWSLSEGVTLTRQRDASLVIGNNLPSGYQLMSPPLDVPPNQVVAVQIVGAITRGEMCVGILDGAQQRWLLAPSDARAGLLADTRDYTQIRLVFSNCANPPGEFTVRSITYQAFPPEP